MVPSTVSQSILQRDPHCQGSNTPHHTQLQSMPVTLDQNTFCPDGTQLAFGGDEAILTAQARHRGTLGACDPLLLFFITLKPRVE